MRHALSLALVAWLAGPAPASAQPVVGPLDGDFGSSVVSGTVTGEVDATVFGRTGDGPCDGFLTTTPNHRLILDRDYPDLVVRAETYGDAASLVVHGPQGMRCTGLPLASPELAGPWPAGTYTIYIGAQTQYGYVGYDLLVAETPDEMAALEVQRAAQEVGTALTFDDDSEGLEGILVAPEDSAIDGPSGGGGYGLALGSGAPGIEGLIGADSYGEVQGPAGNADGEGLGGLTGADWAATPFDQRPPANDPIVIDATAITALVFNGTILVDQGASALDPPASSACAGWVNTRPDFSIQLSAATDSLLLELDSPVGPTLARYGPIGDDSATWTCSAAPSAGAPARLSGHWAPGRYLVWLGTAGDPGAYHLTVAGAP